MNMGLMTPGEIKGSQIVLGISKEIQDNFSDNFSEPYIISLDSYTVYFIITVANSVNTNQRFRFASAALFSSSPLFPLILILDCRFPPVDSISDVCPCQSGHREAVLARDRDPKDNSQQRPQTGQKARGWIQCTHTQTVKQAAMCCHDLVQN